MKSKVKSRKRKHTKGRNRLARLRKDVSITLLPSDQVSTHSNDFPLLQLNEIFIDSGKLKNGLMEDEWYKTVFASELVQVSYHEVNPELLYKGSLQFDVMKAYRRAHQKILLGKWLKYGLFHNHDMDYDDLQI